MNGMVLRPAGDAALHREQRAVERAQRGDLAALEPVLAAHSEALFALLLGRCGDRALAEDLLRDAFVAAMERIGSYTHRGRSMYPWLRQIVLHRLIDHYRALGRRRRLCESLQEELSAGEGPEQPLQALTAEEERTLARQRIERTLAGLHPRYAETIRLRLCEERPREECARLLQVTLPTFDVLLLRAVRAFRKAYGEPDGE